MIKILDKYNCCGCSACTDICPKQCINMTADPVEGYKYAVADASVCIDCGMCHAVCPVENIEHDTERPHTVYAAVNPDSEERKASSSGGAFSLLSRAILDCGGTVFGVAFTDDYRHAKVVQAENVEQLESLRGAKYIQADTAGSYRKVAELLKSDRKVLFSGTPCMVKALRRYLLKKAVSQENLLTVDVVCHGVPSDKAFDAYLCNRRADKPIRQLSFRYERRPYGWCNYAVEVVPSAKRYIPASRDLFMRSFIGNVNLRPSCYQCPAKMDSGCDLSLGDFWGYPHSHDNQGISLVIARTARGEEFIRSIGIMLEPFDYDVALKGNPCIEECPTEPATRPIFWELYRSDFRKAVSESVGLPQRPSLSAKGKALIYELLKRLKLR